MRILAVDDDPFILELLPMFSLQAGFPDMSTAPSGAAGLEVLETSEVPFDCLLLDINMPEMDGIELCSRVRAMPAYRKTPIIMLTAMKEKDYIDRAFEAGATDYASKPIDMAELRAGLRMAQELNVARKSNQPAENENAPQSPSHQSGTPSPLSEGVMIEGIKNLVDGRALENYLRQLSRAGLGGSQIFAVKIHQIDAIHSRASAAEFLYALTEVIDAISNALGATRHLMSYIGDGNFIIVSNKPNLETSGELESEIQNILDEKNSEYDNGDPLDIEVSIGNPIRPNTSEAQMIEETFKRAIARAEARVAIRQNEPRPVNIRSPRSL